jgi:Protein of unknown function (DUF1018)
MEPIRKRAAATAPDRGRADFIKAIHAKARSLALDESARRDLMQTLTQVRSCTDMSIEQLAHVNAHLSKLLVSGAPARAAKFRARPKLSGGQRKVFAMWKALEANGTIRRVGEASLRGFVKRLTACDDLCWCDERQCTTMINALQAWIERVGAESLPRS